MSAYTASKEAFLLNKTCYQVLLGFSRINDIVNEVSVVFLNGF